MLNLDSEVTPVTASYYKDKAWYKMIYLLVFVSKILRSELLHCISTWATMTTSTSVVGMTSWFLRHFNYNVLHDALRSIWRNNETTYLDSNIFILEKVCLFWVYFVTNLVQCFRMGLNLHCLDCSSTNIVVILLDAPSYDVTGKEVRNWFKRNYVTCVLLKNLWSRFY